VRNPSDGLNNGENSGQVQKAGREVGQYHNQTGQKKNCNRNINEQHLSPARTGSSFYYRGPITFLAKEISLLLNIYIFFCGLSPYQMTGERNFSLFFYLLIFKIYV